MSFPDDTKKSSREKGPDADRFDLALSLEDNKPDFKELDLGSPVSPLRSHHAAKAVSSSSSSSGSMSAKTSSQALPRKSESHSGELSGSSEGSPTGNESGRSNRSRSGHRRSNSGSLISGSVTSPNANLLPSGNICPSGKIGKSISCRSSTRSDTLSTGTCNYGHGSIMRGKSSSDSSGAVTGNVNSAGPSVMVKKGMSSTDPEEVRRIGNEQYRRGNIAEALSLYERAISISPDNAPARANRAAALMSLGRLIEAVEDCEEAVKLDRSFARAHHRLVSLYLRLGQVENAQTHFFAAQPLDPVELQRLRSIQRHLTRCENSRVSADWKSVLREGSLAIEAGADSCIQLFAVKAEALLKLFQLKEADSVMSNLPKLGSSSTSCCRTRFFGMLCDSYPLFVRAQVEMSLGRLENAVASAEKASKVDPSNSEIMLFLSNVRLVARARALGNELFNSGKFLDASIAYGEGLSFDSCNPVLYCNRAACRFKLGQWEKSIVDCNEALRILPNYTKALLRRAASNDKLERWADSVRDYELLQKECPYDRDVAEALFHAQVALKKFKGEEVYNMKFGGEVEEISGVESFASAISSSGVSVVHFMTSSDPQCQLISSFVDILCLKYPSINFLKVNVAKNPALAETENVKTTPTVKVYKNGLRLKEMVCPTGQVIEQTIRHYST